MPFPISDEPPQVPQAEYPRPDQMSDQRGRTFQRLFIMICIAGAFAFVLIVVVPLLMMVRISDGKEEQIECIGSMKQMVHGQLLYAADHDDKLPLAETWYEDIRPFTTSTGCPLSGRELVGYGMNDRFSHESLAKVHSPRTQILLFESEEAFGSAHGDPKRACVIKSRHREGYVVGYVDGHAASIPLPWKH